MEKCGKNVEKTGGKVLDLKKLITEIDKEINSKIGVASEKLSIDFNKLIDTKFEGFEANQRIFRANIITEDKQARYTAYAAIVLFVIDIAIKFI